MQPGPSKHKELFLQETRKEEASSPKSIKCDGREELDFITSAPTQ
jgi:hypothetical protein